MAPWPDALLPTQRQATLMPGGLSVTGPNWSLQTLVGSCVAVLLWDGTHRRAGMCHFVLPARVQRGAWFDPPGALDGRYGVEALHILKERMQWGARKDTGLLVHVVGGAALLTGADPASASVGPSNVRLALDWVAQQGLTQGQVHVGGGSGRRVDFDTSTGELLVTEVSSPAPLRGRGLVSAWSPA